MNRFSPIVKWIHRKFRSCPTCGSLSEPQFLLCPVCWARLLETASPMRSLSGHNKLSVTSLWTWERDINRWLSVFLSALKRHDIEEDWAELAGRLSTHFQAIGLKPIHENYAFVPCPPSTKSKADHALMLANALGSYWQAPVYNALEKMEAFEKCQKQKKKWERASLSVVLIEKNSKHIPPGSHIVLIDDILTTGSTAQACVRALGPSFTYEVWCLAHRRLAAATPL